MSGGAIGKPRAFSRVNLRDDYHVKLVKFSATNYRSITSAHRINFSDSTVLIGRNNEGKSNLLRALGASMKILGWHAENRPSMRGRTYLPDEAPYVWLRDFPV